MTESQKNVIGACEKALQKAREGEMPETITNSFSMLADIAKDCELVVPVVGAFSSGKSSLINSLMGENVLPVAITPETSLATELHYSPADSFIDAVKQDDTTVRYSVENIKKMSDDAANYVYARAYLNNPRLREIEPLVLVDMPGFDSPLDAHNKAIMAYLARGCYYIVLSSVEEGTVLKSLERRLREIDNLDRDFSFFITKADLKPEGTVKQLTAYYHAQLSDNFDKDIPVEAVMSKSAESVMKRIKGIDTDKIFYRVFRGRLLDLCQEFITSLNLQIKTLKQDSEKIEAAINEMQAGIEKLRKKAEANTVGMSRYAVTTVDDVVADVGRELDAALDELVGIAASGRQEETERRINEIVRSTLSVSLRNKLETVNHNIVMDFSSSLQGLDRIMRDIDIDGSYIQNLSDKIQTAFTNLQTVIWTGTEVGGASVLLGGTAAKLGTKVVGRVAAAGGGAAVLAGGGAAAAAGGVLAAIAPIALPVIGIVLLFLPELLGPIMKKYQEKKLREELQQKFAGEVFPQLKRKLREELPTRLDEQIDLMVRQVSAQYEERIQLEKEAIDRQAAEKSKGKAEIEAKQQQLEALRSDVQTITNEIMEWNI